MLPNTYTKATRKITSGHKQTFQKTPGMKPILNYLFCFFMVS